MRMPPEPIATASSCSSWIADWPIAILAILYVVSVAAIVVSAMRSHGVARAAGLPAVTSACVVTGALVYMSMLIPGVIGALRGPAVFATLITLSAALLAALRHRGEGTPIPPRLPWIERQVPEEPSAYRLALVVGGIGCVPILHFFATAPSMMLSRGWPLAWDAVSYHLPGFVDYLQDCSLWSVDVPFQSYSFGFELLGGFPATFFASHWGFVVAHCYAVVFVIAALLALVGRLVRRLEDWTDLTVVLASVVTVALWCIVFGGQLWEVGKNDIFVAACILAMLALLLEPASDDNLRRRQLIPSLATAAMVLAVASKPTAIAFVPIYAVLLLPHVTRGSRASRLRDALRCLALVGVVGLGGGFFYVRNILKFGSMTDPALVPVAIRTSIAGNLENPRLYRLTWDSAIFLLAIASVAVLGLPWLRSLRLRLPVLGIWFTGLAAFLVTPWVVFQTEGVWHLRLGMVFFTIAAATCAIAIARWVERVRRVPSRTVTVVVSLIALSFLPWWWSDPTPRGLPGFERSRRPPPSTGIYRWIQGLQRPHRIYAAGLFPYGLYGMRWTNRVVYDLSTSRLDGTRGDGTQRILSVIETFKPDLIVVALDAFRPYVDEKPQISWLRRQPFLIEVYCDHTASAFAVVHDETSKRAWKAAECRTVARGPAE
jgi:hypothetical protein